MNENQLYEIAAGKIQPDSDLVAWHLQFLDKMVGIDSRSFNVNEFEGDRTTPSDMKEILHCAEDYLCKIGFTWIKINTPPLECSSATPILLAEIAVSEEKPTILFYAHLDKQPYMDDGRFQKWAGVPPTKLRWNEDRSRAYGRGAADDLSGVVSIGMSIDALLKTIQPENSSKPSLKDLPCNIKVIYETEEECGSHSLAQQIRQNQEFFSTVDCVVITDVVNPATGIPGLTTSLRGVIQLEVALTQKGEHPGIDAQTALYKLLATLIHPDHSLAVDKIAQSDIPETPEEISGYANVPITVEMMRAAGGLLPDTKLTVPSKKETLLLAQLRKSFVNVRPGHRVSGSIIFGSAGARLTFSPCQNAKELKIALDRLLSEWNRFDLNLSLTQLAGEAGNAMFDLVIQSATKDPHSGMHGGPFPIPELQLATMIDRLIHDDGSLHSDIISFLDPSEGTMNVQSLRVDLSGKSSNQNQEALYVVSKLAPRGVVESGQDSRPFDNPSAKAVIEIRLAPGNRETRAGKLLTNHLKENLLPGFESDLQMEKGCAPWMTECEHPVFSLVMEALEKGFDQKSCLYGCGGSIPFVAKLLDALGDVQPICLGAYDSDSRMHEPGESLSLVDLLGCSRSIIYLMAHVAKAYPTKKATGL